MFWVKGNQVKDLNETVTVMGTFRKDTRGECGVAIVFVIIHCIEALQ